LLLLLERHLRRPEKRVNDLAWPALPQPQPLSGEAAPLFRREAAARRCVLRSGCPCGSTSATRLGSCACPPAVQPSAPRRSSEHREQSLRNQRRCAAFCIARAARKGVEGGSSGSVRGRNRNKKDTQTPTRDVSEERKEASRAFLGIRNRRLPTPRLMKARRSLPKKTRLQAH
jgi:hypothetical protein